MGVKWEGVKWEGMSTGTLTVSSVTSLSRRHNYQFSGCGLHMV